MDSNKEKIPATTQVHGSSSLTFICVNSCSFVAELLQKMMNDQNETGIMHHTYLPSKKAGDNRGFTLIEIAVVMVIIGIVISIVTSVLPSLIQSAKIRKAQAILERVDYALQGYSMTHHRLPCADSNGDGREESGVYMGTLPYVTIGLSYAEDPWTNSIKYAVYNDLTEAFADRDDFCTAISNAGTAAFAADKVYTNAVDNCSSADETNSANQAYIVASGGAKDLDGANGFFDLCNGEYPPGFNAPDRIQSPDYDDVVRAFSFYELLDKNCAGSGGDSGSSSASEICNNGIDDDGDGLTDCDDPDCAGDPACADAENLIITTDTIPSGPVNSNYSAVTFQAQGGTTPYEWTLTSNGGFTDFSLNTYTGHLSGTLDQCPGTYSISVQVEDSTLVADGGPKTASKDFSLQVTKNLSISRTSGSGTAITWDSPNQEETFKAYGGHIGDIEWQLNTGGATGFTVSSEGSDTCLIKKNGTTTPGIYAFTLTATDATCPSNIAQFTLNVTVTSAGGGAPSDQGPVGQWHFDENTGTIAYDSADGNDGTITDATWTTGVSLTALNFDGIDDCVSCGNDANLGFTDAFTLEAWVKASSSQPDNIYGRIVDKFSSKYEKGYSMNRYWTFDTVLLEFYADDADYTHCYVSSSTIITDDSWHYVVGTYDGTVLKIYIDGNLENQTETGGKTISISSNPLSIGNSDDDNVYQPLAGSIDEVAVYNWALGADEIAECYNANKP